MPEQLVVVKRSPRKRKIVVAASALAGLLLLCLTYYIGFSAALATVEDARIERDKLQQTLQQLNSEFAETRLQLVRAERGADIDRQATENIRQLVRDLEQQIYDQKEEIAFYKGLMSPGEREQGLSIRGWTLKQDSDAGQLQYELVVQQLAVSHRLLKGYVTVTLLGTQDGKPASLQLAQVAEDLADTKIKLRFKYFQSIAGKLKLPENFQPQKVEVVAQSIGTKPATVERSYDWVVQET